MGEGRPKYLFKDEEGSHFQSLCPIGAHTEEPCRNLKSRKYSEPSPFRKSPSELPKIEAHGKSDLKGAEPSAAFPPEESFPPLLSQLTVFYKRMQRLRQSSQERGLHWWQCRDALRALSSSQKACGNIPMRSPAPHTLCSHPNLASP